MVLKGVYSKGNGNKDKNGKFVLRYIVTLEMSATDYKALRKGRLFARVKGRDVKVYPYKHKEKHGYVSTKRIDIED